MVNEAMQAVVGRDIRAAREAAGYSQQNLADLFENGRDWTSKLENGLINVSLADYLELIDYLRETMPENHPALGLVTYFKRRRAKA